MSSLRFTPAPLTEAGMWGVTPFDQIQCRLAFRSNRYDGNPFTPPQTSEGAIIWPGNIGVFNWGSVAVDPVHHWMIATPQYLPYIYRLLPRPPGEPERRLVGADPEASPVNENLGGPYAISIAHMRSALGIPCSAPPGPAGRRESRRRHHRLEAPQRHGRGARRSAVSRSRFPWRWACWPMAAP
ncbi:hypothetical protein ACU4GA_26060 [Methylobacterium oryzae CBMB20]